MKKLIALLLALVMVLGMVACGKTDAPAADAPAADAPAADAPAADAPAEREHVTLKWYVAHAGPQADTAAVLEEVNKYLTEKLNCSLELVESDFGTYTDKMQMVIGSQEEFDICWTSHWCNNFYSNIAKNAFLELDELVATYAPEMQALVPQGGWDACKVNGNLYGVPSMQIWAMTNCVGINIDVAAEYGLPTEDFDWTLDEMEAFLAAYKADHPDEYPLGVNSQGNLSYNTFNIGYDELAGRHIPGVVMLDDESLTVVNQFELPEVQAFYQRMYDWAQKGYIRPDAATVLDANADMKSGMHVAVYGGTYKPEPAANQIASLGTEVVFGKLSGSYLTTSGITATMNAISRTSKHPERAMEFLNLLNTDPYLYNLITQGVAGVHYEDLGEGYIRAIEGSGYAPNADWMFGNQFLAYLKEGQDPTDWIETEKLNANSTPSVAMGFVFDSVPVQSEIAAVSAVIGEYEAALSTGVLDPNEYLPEFLEKLEQAGSDVIIAEIQSQLDAWAAANA